MKDHAQLTASKNENPNTNLTAIKWVLCAIALLAAFCASGGVSNAASVTDGFMVRAVLIEQDADGYTVAVLYQDPEAAANSAEVSAPFSIAQATGDSLAGAFATLEQTLAAPVSYQLGDYLLLCGTPSLTLLREYAALVQSIGCGRYAAQVCYSSVTVAAFAQQAEASQTLAEGLFTLLEQSEQLPASLFDAAQASFLVPQIEQAADGSFAPLQTSYLLSESGGMAYDATQTQLYCLLAGDSSTCEFLMGGISFTISTRLSSRSGSLTGVSDDITTLWFGNKVSDMSQSAANTAQNTADVAQNTLPTLHLYALVQSTSDASPDALAQMVLYLEALVNTQPALLAQLGVSGVQVTLY